MVVTEFKMQYALEKRAGLRKSRLYQIFAFVTCQGYII